MSTTCRKKSEKLIRDFTQGNVVEQMLSFSAPLFFSNLLQTVYNMVDMIIVGKVVGKTGLSAVSVGGDLTNFLTFFAMGLSNAGQVLISQYLGRGEKEKLSSFIRTMCNFLLLLAIGISIICFLLRNSILQIMNTPEESYMETLRYATVCIAGLFFIYGYNMVGAVLRGLGDSKHPFQFIALAAVINILLDFLFVVQFRWNAMGAAFATVISQGVSFLLCVRFLIHNQEQLELKFSGGTLWEINLPMLRQLIQLGIPMALKNAAIQLSKIVVNTQINLYGVEVSAVAGIANKLNSIITLFSNSVNAAGASMIGQNIGAKRYERVSAILKVSFIMTFTISCIAAGLLLLFPGRIFNFFTNDEIVIQIAMEYLPVAIIVFMGSAGRAPMNALINGSGNYRLNFVTAILDGLVLRIGLAFGFGIYMHLRYVGFWLGDALSGFVPVVVGGIFYFSGKWKAEKG